MSRVHAYLRPQPGEPPPFNDGRPSPTAKAVQSFAEAQGAGALTWWIETSAARPSRVSERPQGAEMLRTLREGDTLLTHTLADLCDLPSDLDRLIKGCAGRGIDVIVVSTANADRSKVLKSAVDAFAPLEAELAKARAELSKVQAVADERLKHAQQVMASQLISNFGLPPGLAMGVPTTIGPVDKPLTNGATGAVIKAKREAKGLTQQALGEALGMEGPSAQSNVSKLETGKTDYMWKEALAYLSEGGEVVSGA